MIKHIFHALLTVEFTCTLLAGEAHLTLHLKERELTLKDVFDAGIRPKKRLGATSQTLQFHAESLTVIFSNNQRITTRSGYGQFHVHQGDIIVGFKFYEDYCTGFEEVEERINIAREALSGKGRTQKQVSQDIDEMYDSGGRLRLKSPIRIGGFQTDKWAGNLRVHDSSSGQNPFRFIWSMSYRYPRAIDTPPYRKLSDSLTPPEGYEHVSMEPKTQLELGDESIKIDQQNRPQNRSNKQENSAQNSKSFEDSKYWLWMLILISIFSVGALLIRLKTMSKQV